MGVTKKAKITFTCEPSLKDGLEEWAQSESRTLSNLIEMLIRLAYEERFSSADRPSEPQPTDSQPPTAEPAAAKGKRGKASKGAS
ncbi:MULTISPECIES: ribbon-helix-helix domain-containing protein [unclassified Microcoleus]|uniref:ribbon-helix-helix domain-containing protein n=1 Tax=unclassified Microcoleus TaxID=2642155 RepID=UPI002FD7002D